ncbi:MAG: carbon-nitrogen hydrolase family protein [Candidatus Abyssobacteria bacterium SURF_17]|uniref:Carbon-nitrogen hydrolase family protein n=1 Tax=Candidatus Abyssobacteria bacterium SURF_17 TaxID=2093361 RepID=A0A419F0J8_9BACT|nr:MAG: carbon-nitrogen hydrolase family protein [Candidatus Abyssubacteria bacterium SURF_17]
MAKLTVAGIQMGPYPGSYRANMEKAVEALGRAVSACRPDFVCFSEMMTGPYFCRIYDDGYFNYAESIPGPTTETLAAEARKHRVNVIGTVFEEDKGSYYNSAILLSRDGTLMGKYRKTHVPKSSSPLMNSDEKYYFKPGNELPVFQVNGITVGILICFDRSFPETFRTLALKGAELVFVPVASWGLRADSFQAEVQVRAVENQLFVVAVNKAGFEQIAGEDEGREHFGRSCIVGPFGEIEASVGTEPWGFVSAMIDLDKRKLMRETLVDWLSERRPELYGPITQEKRE